jgi:hypothetical protein
MFRDGCRHQTRSDIEAVARHDRNVDTSVVIPIDQHYMPV